MARINFKETYKDCVGACASCSKVRSFRDVKEHKNHMPTRELLPYDGGKQCVCLDDPNLVRAMVYPPRMDLPANECWVSG